MPIYEYRCRGCGRRLSVLFRRIRDDAPSPACTACGAPMSRCLAGFAYHRSEATRRAEAGDPDRPGPDYYQDPRNIGRWAEKRFQEMGMDLPGEIKEKIAAARDGDLPGPVKDL